MTSTLANEGTILILDGMGIPLHTGQDLTQTLEPIPQASNLRRDINGNLVDVSRPSFQKYRSKITCTSAAPPAFDGIWPGKVLTVHCAVELSYPSAGTPSRSAVPGSDYAMGDFRRYRPILTMRVMNNPNQLAEWKSDNSWELDLEEV